MISLLRERKGSARVRSHRQVNKAVDRFQESLAGRDCQLSLV
jgi:hypothetical protein